MKSLKKVLTTVGLGVALSFGAYVLPTIINTPTVYAADVYSTSYNGNSVYVSDYGWHGGHISYAVVKLVSPSGELLAQTVVHYEYIDGVLSFYRSNLNGRSYDQCYTPVYEDRLANDIYYTASHMGE